MVPHVLAGLVSLCLNDVTSVTQMPPAKNRWPVRLRAHDAIPLYVPLPKSELFTKSNKYYKPVICNSLPPNIRSINDPNQYKTEIKRY